MNGKVQIIEAEEELVFSKSYTTTANIGVGAESNEKFISQADIDKYAPFNIIHITSDDTMLLGCLFNANPDNKLVVSAKGSVAANIQKFSQFTIKNLGAAEHTAGKVYVTVQKTEKFYRGA